MKTRLAHIPSVNAAFQSVDAALSFACFAEYVRKGLDSSGAMQRNLYRILQKQLEKHPELSNPVPVDDINQYEELLQMIYVSMTGISRAGEEALWAIGMPLPGTILYGTDSFYEIIEDKSVNRDEDMAQAYLASVYALILKRCYALDTFLYERMMHSINNPEDRYRRHYRVSMDYRFVRISNKGALPRISPEELEEHIHTGDAIPFLSRQLPLRQFDFSGFTIISVSDETGPQSVRTIKNLLLQNAPASKKEYIPCLIESLQSIVASDAIDFGFFPFVELNGKFLLQLEDISHSILLNPDRPPEETEAILLPALQRFARHPAPLFIKDLSSISAHKSLLWKDFKRSGYQALALVPLYDDGQLIGIMEVCSRREHILTQRLVAKLDPVLPYLARMLKRRVDDFHAKMAQIINEKFTSIQPSVQWKFKEVVRAYLLECRQNGSAVIAPVRFEHVAPFFGAVDIRNSTWERTMARRKDLERQFDLLIPLLFELRKASGGGLPIELLQAMNTLLEGQWYQLSPEYEARVAHFFGAEMHPFLIRYKELQAIAPDIIDAYFEQTDARTGLLNHHKSVLEASISLINDSVSSRLNQLSEELQAVHTCYFESYRSDGVEYDVFAGDSITPQRPFDPSLLHDFRLRQLQSMVAIAGATHDLLPQMPVPLQTTQLIFIHDEWVDIGYREKERRFDIDNVYHLRYQIIKKRLDKAQVKGTGERLTQPGKIAIVFSQSADLDPYLSLIKGLQNSGSLLQAELVELEELQGIGGLKALIVPVHFPSIVS